MTDDLESALKQLLKNVVREVAAGVVKELKASVPHQAPPSTPTDGGFLLKPRETAKRLAISERHLFQLTRTGQLPCVRVGKCVRYNIETIQKWVRDTESPEPPPRSERDDFKQTLTASESPRRMPKRPTRQKKRVPASEKGSVPEQCSPNVRHRVSNGKPKEVQSKERISPLSVLLSELGIARGSLPPITNGELMRIAEVDIATMHGWQYLDKPLPAEAMNRLTNHFRCLVTERQVGE